MVRMCLLVLVVLLAGPAPVQGQGEGEWSGQDDAAMDYLDPVDVLLTRIERGDVQLTRDPEWGYLPAVLRALDIPLSSQTLVFSRTSLQVDVIAPWAPRAIYFNDDVYVGYTVDGLVLEIAAVDPDGGSVFYTVDQRDERDAHIRRDDLTCKGCHDTGITGGVSGVMMRSFLTDRMGNTVTPIYERPVDDRTPMSERFGGWYVTGRSSLPHAGNVRAEAMVHEIDQPDDFLASFPVGEGTNTTELGEHFDGSFYPVEGSDIVALMVLAHQTRVHNLITIAAETAREVEQELGLLHLTTGESVDGLPMPEALADRLDFAAERLVRGLLFFRAEPIGIVEGTSSFAAEFASRGPHDSRGRSLRTFSLDGRLFEYPLSFLIYSDAWDALPPLIRDRAWLRLSEVLTGGDSDDYPLLDEERRRAILDILRDTKPEFAAYAGPS